MAAQDYCDNHLSAIPREIAQMLANAFSLERLALGGTPRTQKGTARRHSYFNHPMSRWIRRSKVNYEWTLAHYFELIEEKRRRFPNKPSHFTIDFAWWVKNRIEEIGFEEDGWSQPPQCFSGHNECVRDNPVDGYKLYFSHYKRHLAQWTNKEQPEWYE